MTESGDIPKIELEPDDYFEHNEPRERRSDEEIAAELEALMYSHYSEETLRQVLGDEVDEERLQKVSGNE